MKPNNRNLWSFTYARFLENLQKDRLACHFDQHHDLVVRSHEKAHDHVPEQQGQHRIESHVQLHIHMSP